MTDFTDAFGRRRRHIRDVFAIRAFRLFSMGNFMSLAAIWVVRICVGWITWELTHSKTWLGVMAFAELGPSVLVSLYAGPLADRRNRFEMLRAGQALQTALAVALVALSMAKALNVWWLLAILLGFSVIGGFTLPARLSVAPSLVPGPQLATASAIGSLTLNVTRMIGPMLAAPMLYFDIEWAAFALAALGFAANALCLSAIGAEGGGPPPAPAADVGGYGAVIRQIAGDRALALILSLQLALGGLVRPLTDMFPAYADVMFGQSERGYTALISVVGVGAMIGAVIAMGETTCRTMRLQVLGGSAAFAASMAAFAVSQQFAIALFICLIFGLMMTITGVASTTFVQLRTPRDRLGRVMSIYSIIFRLAPALGALLLGAMADSVGLQAASLGFSFAALVCIALVWTPLLRANARQAEGSAARD